MLSVALVLGIVNASYTSPTGATCQLNSPYSGFNSEVCMYNNYQNDYWGYDSLISTGTSSSSWSQAMQWGLYCGNGDISTTTTYYWGDGTSDTISFNSGSSWLSSKPTLTVTVDGNTINNVPFCSGSFGYTTVGSTAFSAYYSSSNTEMGSNGAEYLQLNHEYSSTGIYSAYIYVSTGGGKGETNTLTSVIISNPQVSTPSLGTTKLDYGSSSSEPVTITYNCGSNTLCPNNYMDISGTSISGTSLYSAQNQNSPQTVTEYQSSTTPTGTYYVSGSIYNPISNNVVFGSDGQFQVFPAIGTPSLTVQSNDVQGTVVNTIPMTFTITVNNQGEGSPNAIIFWGDGTNSNIPAGSSQWSQSGSNYVATITHNYGSYTGSANIQVVMESNIYVNIASAYGTSSSNSESITVNPYVYPQISISPPTSIVCGVNGIYTTKSGNYVFSLTQGSEPLSSLSINWGGGNGNPSPSLSGTGSQSITVSNTYGSQGSPTITATVYDNQGKSASSSKTISVSEFGEPTIDTPSPSSAIATQSQTYSVTVGAGTCPLNQITWNWHGLSGTSNTASAFSGTNSYAHTYQITQGTTSTSYNLNVQVSDNAGDISSASQSIGVSYVYPSIGSVSPTTVFANGNQYGANYSNTFSTSLSAGTNPLNQITWNWGDGTTNTINNANIGTNTASHAYASSGTYTIGLTVSDTSNYYNTASDSITVNPYPIFTLSAIGNASIIYRGVPSTFNITITEATGGFQLSNLIWDFGDNTTPVSISNPQYGLNNETHIYSSAGTYTITATAYDSNNAHVSQTATITVTPYNPPSLTNFSIVNYPNINPQNTTTTGLSSLYSIYLGQGNETVENMTFNWGDGTNNTFLNATTNPAMVVGGYNNVTHTYASAGNYTLTITATDSLGFSGQFQYTVSVSSYTNPDIISFLPKQAIVNQTTYYNITLSEGSVYLSNITVNFDGTNVTQNVSEKGGIFSIPYSMSNSGDVPISVTVCDILGNCTTDNYQVYNQILPIITAFYNENYNGYNYNKINTSFILNITAGSNALANLTMYFGDGNTQFVNLNNNSGSVSLQLNDTYSSGTYTAYFIVYDSNNNLEQSNSLIETISNYQYGYVNNITPISVYDVVPDTFTFNLTQGSFPIKNINVSWGDNSINTTQSVPINATSINLTHTYPFALNQSYNIIATVCDVNFCTAFGKNITTTYVIPVINSVSPTSAFETVPTNFTFNITQGTFALQNINVVWGDNSTSFPTITNDTPILNHTYASSGTYTLTAYAGDINGQNSNPFTQVITVNPYVYPYVSSMNPRSVIAGENINYSFVAQQGTFPISNLTINWGNGQIIPYYNITNGTNTINFLYTANGNFTAIETIYDTRGISSQNSTIIKVSPAPYSFTTQTPIINYTITNVSKPNNILFNLNYTGNATLITNFTAQQDNFINNFVCSQSVSPNPTTNSTNPTNITLSVLCSINPNAISLAPQTLYITTYADNTAGNIESITEQININTTISLPQIPTPFNQNLTVSTPYPVSPYSPIDITAVLLVVIVTISFIFVWFRR